jgi:hypothetical protein
MSDRDVDAQFADIIAHWDDVAPLPERGPEAPQTNEPPSADLTTDLADDGTAAPPSPGLPDEVAGDSGAASRSGVVNPSPLNPAINPPPSLGSIPVWRGAMPPPDAGEAEDTVGGAEPFDDEDHFEPGPVAPLPPQEDLHFWGIVVGLVAGPLLLLWLVIFRPDVSDWWLLAALGLIVGGFVLLVLRQPHSRDEDDPDNGARV